MEDTGGTITIGIENAVKESRNFVRLSVSDTGKGLDPENADKYLILFTLRILEGISLGLAVVHGM